MKKVISGIVQFKKQPFEARSALFAELANGQSPEVLMVTSADSRIDPSLITQTEPGELFVCRTAGNIIPPHSHNADGVTASIEYAVAVLGVEDIIVCGHTDCGAMKGAMNLDAASDLPHIRRWLDHSRAAVETVDEDDTLDAAERLLRVTEENVVLQLQHVRTHPAVARRLANGRIGLHGWVYHIESGEVTCYDETTGRFAPLEERYANLLGHREDAIAIG
ncbi:MAG: carbonic anhydrase [Pseudomonadota bacterium]